LHYHVQVTTGEAKFPECRGTKSSLSVAPGKLREERHSGKALFPECNIRGREALMEYLTAQMDGAILKTLFPECFLLAVGEASLFRPFPECLGKALGKYFFSFFAPIVL
jgi:hypothetical protein